MSVSIIDFERGALVLVFAGFALSMTLIVAVIVQRLVLLAIDKWDRRVRGRYAPLVARAIQGDAGARQALADAPGRHHVTIARLLLEPLIDDRSPERIGSARAIIQAMSLIAFAERLLRSPFWWRRAVAVRAYGLLQVTSHTKYVVAALDDSHPHVRNTALDALADMQDPAALPAIVVRLLDPTLHRGRRAAALTALGPRAEIWLLELAAINATERLAYARALSLCGGAASRPLLRQWAADASPDIRVAALESLARIGLDAESADVARSALESEDASIRAAAAGALRHWHTPHVAADLARHLDDEWPVAVRAAHSLRESGPGGRRLLESRAEGTGLGARLARQMLWEAGHAS